jgi:hypothetical protein
MPPFRLTVPHPHFLLISARYVYETLAFQKKCRPAMEKKILTIQETQIINGWYTFSPQRPTNGLNTFFLGFFFQRGHKIYSKRNGSKFPKTSISVPGHSPKRRTPTRRSIARSPSRDSWHWEAAQKDLEESERASGQDAPACRCPLEDHVLGVNTRLLQRTHQLRARSDGFNQSSHDTCA